MDNNSCVISSIEYKKTLLQIRFKLNSNSSFGDVMHFKYLNEKTTCTEAFVIKEISNA